jgi:hypothetical protein
MASTMLRGTTGVATGRYRGLILLGFAAVMSLLVALIAGPWRDGFPTDKFWAVWGIMALILIVVSLFAAIMQRVLGALGTLVTVIVIIPFGKPSSGGANGVPYLPDFWNAIGPYLPPQNGYILPRNSVYFGGNGITRPLVVLLVYFFMLAALIGILDWYRRPAPALPAVSHETEAAAAASATPAGVAI